MSLNPLGFIQYKILNILKYQELFFSLFSAAAAASAAGAGAGTAAGAADALGAPLLGFPDIAAGKTQDQAHHGENNQIFHRHFPYAAFSALRHK